MDLRDLLFLPDGYTPVCAASIFWELWTESYKEIRLWRLLIYWIMASEQSLCFRSLCDCRCYLAFTDSAGKMPGTKCSSGETKWPLWILQSEWSSTWKQQRFICVRNSFGKTLHSHCCWPAKTWLIFDLNPYPAVQWCHWCDLNPSLNHISRDVWCGSHIGSPKFQKKFFLI